MQSRVSFAVLFVFIDRAVPDKLRSSPFPTPPIRVFLTSQGKMQLNGDEKDSIRHVGFGIHLSQKAGAGNHAGLREHGITHIICLGENNAIPESKRLREYTRDDGTTVKVEYFTTFPTNHELQFTNTLGKDLPLIDWDTMTQAMRDALSNTDFGSANVPFKDSNFVNNLNKASM